MMNYLLMGGLGNQLFQLAGAMHHTEAGSKVILVDKVGNPRTNKGGFAEISSFKLPTNVYLQEIELEIVILRKAINLGIRLSAKKQKTEILKSSYTSFSKFLSFLFRERNSYVCISNGVGYDPKFKANRKGLNISYFQSCIYLKDSRTLQSMRGLRINEPSEGFKAAADRAKVEAPLVVHIRLGDYKSEKSFGIPSKQYYSEALKYFDQIDSERPIWLFSNEPEEAIKFIPEKYHNKTHIVPVDTLSSAETLELMRHGTSYIIGNSSFSWWGAALSFSENAKVISPSPWFRGSQTPNDLIPDTWLQFDARYDVQISEKQA